MTTVTKRKHFSFHRRSSSNASLLFIRLREIREKIVGFRLARASAKEVACVRDEALFIPRSGISVVRTENMPDWIQDSLDAEIRRLEEAGF